MVMRIIVLSALTAVVLLALNFLSGAAFPGVSRDFAEALFFVVVVMPSLIGVALVVRVLRDRRTHDKV